jgi:hypothetical protein
VPAIVALIGGAMLVIGSLLTWATVSIDVARFAEALGVDEATLGAAIAGPTSTSASGLSDGADGIFTLIAGVVVGALALLANMRTEARRPIGIVIGIAGVVGAGVALYDISQIDDVRDLALGGVTAALEGTGIGADLLDGVVEVSTGIGIWICLIGDLIAVVAGLMTLSGAGMKRVSAPPEWSMATPVGQLAEGGLAPAAAPPAPPPPIVTDPPIGDVPPSEGAGTGPA